MEKYSWNFNGEAENWGNDTFGTIEECIAAAREAVAEGDYRESEPPTVVYIGENVAFVPRVDPETVLDNLGEEAVDFAGEVGFDWESYDHKRQDELTELADSLSRVVNRWLKKYGYAPSFWAIQNIKRYRL
ncbi:hypothetical protein [Desulfitobacterium hafniense]|uniref:Uncharacterized protein n=1 Tax=Desulfitobacterium hafniense (strain Y51) TaxID=138119 RepID=Q24VF8_DESHY|nr:hypothetical protein [Desulfitobacterium hafniense]BAE83984.1 hypothetical protein DSY2195 [Desulfitobacterium hafniense Y51]